MKYYKILQKIYVTVSKNQSIIYVFCNTFAILSYMKSLSANKPRLIAMVGIPGSGKSYFAEHFAETFKAPIVSFHHFRYELFNEPNYGDDECEIINRVANLMLDELLKTGRTILYEGKTNTRNERLALAKKSRDAGYEALFVWVQTDIETAQKRATKSSDDKTAMTVEQFERQIKKFIPPNQLEKIVVISGKHTYASQLKIVLKRLVEPRPNSDNNLPQPRPITSRNVLIR